MPPGEGFGHRTERVRFAVHENPFRDIIHKFYIQNYDPIKTVDEVYSELNKSPGVDQLIENLLENPKYSTVFHYDPFSIKVGEDRGGCFGYPVFYGASDAYIRVFENLKPEAIRILRTLDEAMVVINQPHNLIQPHGKPSLRINEPAVLFTSKVFENFGSVLNTDENIQLGLFIGHGDTLSVALPEQVPVSPVMKIRYIQTMRPELTKK